MNKPNIGYLFNKSYYSDEYFTSEKTSQEMTDEIKEKNRKLLGIKCAEYQSEKNGSNHTLGNFSLYLKTTYPGLLIGSGYIHEIGEFNCCTHNSGHNHQNNKPENEIFKLGFYFDYTTGLPVIPGSSVKGILRSAFNHLDYIRELLSSLDICSNINAAELDEIKKDIFGEETSEKGRDAYKYDVFYDAEINFEPGSYKPNKKILGDDYITPHWPNLLKNPIPIKFIKVMPGIIFQFKFDLHDSNLLKGTLSSIQKLYIFREILCDIGTGAKTNLGYGQFERQFGLKKMQNDIAQIKSAKEEEKLKGKSELEKRFYYIEKKNEENDNDHGFRKTLDLFTDMEKMEDANDDKKKIALFLKNTWIIQNKWSGKQSKKQKQKVDCVRKVLNE